MLFLLMSAVGSIEGQGDQSLGVVNAGGCDNIMVRGMTAQHLAS